MGWDRPSGELRGGPTLRLGRLELLDSNVDIDHAATVYRHAGVASAHGRAWLVADQPLRSGSVRRSEAPGRGGCGNGLSDFGRRLLLLGPASSLGHLESVA